MTDDHATAGAKLRGIRLTATCVECDDASCAFEAQLDRFVVTCSTCAGRWHVTAKEVVEEPWHVSTVFVRSRGAVAVELVFAIWLQAAFASDVVTWHARPFDNPMLADLLECSDPALFAESASVPTRAAWLDYHRATGRIHDAK